MKTFLRTTTLWLSLGLLAAGARAQEAAPATDSPAPPPRRARPERTITPSTGEEPNLRFNFRGAPLETVLNYMSEAAGFIIVLETPVRGTVDMWSSQPVTKKEAVQLLNVALNRNGYAATLQGRSLIVSSKDDAKKHNIPIHTGADPEEIPATAEVVMQVIPLRHLDATQAATDLASLVPSGVTLTPNADSNSLVVVDTQMNVRHIVEIIAALDSSVDSVSTVKVFPLKNADPTEMATLIGTLFPSQNGAQAQNGRQGAVFAGPGGAGGPGAAIAAAFAARAAGGNNGGRGNNRGGANGSTARSSTVTAVADPRTFSVVVTTSKEMMPEIADIIGKLDSSTARKQKVFVYTMANADVTQVETILKNLFQSSNSRSTTTNTQADPLNTRATTNSQNTSSSSSSTTSSGFGSGSTTLGR